MRQSKHHYAQVRVVCATPNLSRTCSISSDSTSPSSPSPRDLSTITRRSPLDHNICALMHPHPATRSIRKLCLAILVHLSTRIHIILGYCTQMANLFDDRKQVRIVVCTPVDLSTTYDRGSLAKCLSRPSISQRTVKPFENDAPVA